MTIGLSESYQLDESTFILRFSLFDEISLSKQYSHRRVVAFSGVSSWAILFAYVPKIGRQAHVG